MVIEEIETKVSSRRIEQNKGIDWRKFHLVAVKINRENKKARRRAAATTATPSVGNVEFCMVNNIRSTYIVRTWHIRTRLYGN